MLRNTFCHLPGVGLKTEQNLWNSGATTWEEFLEQCRQPKNPCSRRNWQQIVEESFHHYEKNNTQYFSFRLQPNQLWRLYRDFKHTCAFIDIETTGSGGYWDSITTIAVYDGVHVKTYVHGINLDQFPDDILRYKLLVTFNGSSFDLPIIRNQFGLQLRQAHIDLRHVLKSLGFRGGLKLCEKQFGLRRHGLREMDGYAAVLLWREYQAKGKEQVLETLLAYNVADVLSLEVLLTEAYNRKIKFTPFSSTHLLPDVTPVENPFQPDPKVVDRVMNAMLWRFSYRR